MRTDATPDATKAYEVIEGRYTTTSGGPRAPESGLRKSRRLRMEIRGQRSTLFRLIGPRRRWSVPEHLRYGVWALEHCLHVCSVRWRQLAAAYRTLTSTLKLKENSRCA